MTASGPGWNPDPEGMPGAFRWWDGSRWTDALTDDPGSPPPDGSPDPGSAPPDATPAGAVPPPPGAPGPGYLPYDGLATGFDNGTDPPTEVLSAGRETAGRGRVRSIASAVVIFAIAAAGVIYLAYFRTDDAVEQATPAATQEQRTPSDPATPPAAGDVGPGDEPTPDTGDDLDPNEIPAGPRLEYSTLPKPWAADLGAANILTGGQAQTQVTERRYNERDNWVALVATGAADPEWYNADDLAGSAKTAADWFAEEGFTGAEVTQQTRSNRTLTVDGHPARLLEQHFTYRIPGLRSRGEAITIVLVDLGGGAGGVFLASIPDTHERLRSDVRKAMATLTVTE
jgi:hypothetical protein